VLDVVVPVFNEEIDLDPSVRTLHAHLSTTFPYPFRITIADNASTDATAEIAERLAGELPWVRTLRLPQKGRGRALRAAWTASDAQVLAYMDVDLSTDLAALLPLVAPLVTGHSDIAIGTRLARGARVVRGPKRELISRCYNLLLRGTLRARFSDAQCGFKAIRRDVAVHLLPLVEDDAWFFDTELLVLAQRSGLRVHEVPVDWVDHPDSRVDVAATAMADLRGVARLSRGLLTGRIPVAQVRAALGRDPARTAEVGFGDQLARFVSVGIASTLTYALLYLMARLWLPAGWANFTALLLTAIGNTAANRRLTFGVRGRDGAVRQHAQGLAVFLLGLGLTSGALLALHSVAPDAGRGAELAVLVMANLVTTFVRFLALRLWVFRHRRVAPSERFAA